MNASELDTRAAVTLWTCADCGQPTGHPKELRGGPRFTLHCSCETTDIKPVEYVPADSPMYGPEGRWKQLREERDAAVAEREKLLWVIRELHEGACSPAYRPPDSDYRLWALEVIESNIAEEVLNG